MFADDVTLVQDNSRHRSIMVNFVDTVKDAALFGMFIGLVMLVGKCLWTWVC